MLTTRLPSPWNTSLLWPSEDARVLPTLRDSPADREVTVCKAHQQSDRMPLPALPVAWDSPACKMDQPCEPCWHKTGGLQPACKQKHRKESL